MQEWFDFIAKIAWPVVALIGILILGPGGVLRGLLSDLSQSLLKITEAIQDFKVTAANLNSNVERLQGNTAWVSGFDIQLQTITAKLAAISATTQDLAISEGSRSIESTAAGYIGNADLPLLNSADEMLIDIRNRWAGLVEKLRLRLGSSFDARMIGDMAWMLTDRRRKDPISAEQAELISQLASQIKRFTRLQSSKDEWLTPDVYSAVARGIDRAVAGL